MLTHVIYFFSCPVFLITTSLPLLYDNNLSIVYFSFINTSLFHYLLLYLISLHLTSNNNTFYHSNSHLLGSGKCRSVVQGGSEHCRSTKGGRGPRGPPGPHQYILIHTFSNFTENVDQGGSEWTRRTMGTITPLGGPGLR